ncbi:cardiolipin synthase [Buchnera aphidicola (Greenidea ficicola)]
MTFLIKFLILLYVIILFFLIIWFIYKKKKILKKKKISYIMNLKKKYYFNFIKSLKINYNFKNSNLAKPLFKLCDEKQGLSGIAYNNIKILKKNKNIINNIIFDIKNAKKTIEIVFYIWQPGGKADDVAIELIKSAKRGIKCKLMLDSTGSSQFFKSKWFKKMKYVGIKIVESLKINFLKFFLKRIDIRQHRKIIIIDNYIVYTGSMNLVDPKFFKRSSGVGKWVDLMIRIKGSIAITMSMIFFCDWEIETGKRKNPILFKKKKIKNIKKKTLIQVIPSGSGFLKNIIHKVLLTAIYSAKKKIILTTPYFVPSKQLFYAICLVAKRGIKVKIILPKYNDSFLVQWASRSFFTKLLKSGVKIYQFNKGLLHSKIILIDNQLSLFGTLNLDMRSIWLNFEITLIIDDNKFNKKLKKIQHEYILHSKLLILKIWLLRSYWKRLIENIIYLFNPLL